MKFPFFQQFVKSMTDIEWLRAQRKKPGSAWAYYILFIFIIVCVQFLPALWTYPREINALWNQAKQQIPDFQATVENGQLAVDGVEQPLVYQFPFETDDVLLYVNTNTSTAPASPKDVVPENVELAMVVTAQEVTFVERLEGVVESDSFSFSEITERVTFTDEDVVQKGEQVVTWVGRFLVPVILFILFVGVVIGRAIIVGIQAFIAWIAARIVKKPWRYGELFNIGLFAITLPSIVVLLLLLVPIQIPFLFSTLLLLMLLLVIFKEPALEQDQIGKQNGEDESATQEKKEDT